MFLYFRGAVLEIELVWGINARIFYFGQRRWIFDVPLEADLDALIRLTIRHFMAGAREVLPGLVAPQRGHASVTRYTGPQSVE